MFSLSTFAGFATGFSDSTDSFSKLAASSSNTWKEGVVVRFRRLSSKIGNSLGTATADASLRNCASNSASASASSIGSTGKAAAAAVPSGKCHCVKWIVSEKTAIASRCSFCVKDVFELGGLFGCEPLNAPLLRTSDSRRGGDEEVSDGRSGTLSSVLADSSSSRGRSGGR